MSKILVIVESPTKAKTINKYLGSEYIVKSSVGHIRDLPTNTVFRFNNKINNDKEFKINNSFKLDKKANLVNRMGIDPWNNWQANYQILPGKEIVVSELKTLASKVNHIYLATDLDREGEAIAWHLREIIGGDHGRFSRVIFNEITKKSIQQAFKNTSELNINHVNAQQARRFMDRIVGYMISPLLWKKIARGLSAGRVQSVAVQLIIEREREIKSFIPKEYWEINGSFTTPKGENLLMKISSWKNKQFRPINFEQTQEAITTLQKVLYKVRSRENKTTISKPLAPFITSTLQQSASMYLGFNVKKTMLIAQHLYEKGFITYMRTDSTNLSNDAIEMARIYIEKNFGKNYLPYKKNKYVNEKKSQEAHEAIRPSNINIVVEQLNDESDVKKLYNLIWCQFIGSQMASAKYNSTQLKVCAEDFELKAMGRTLLFDGCIKVMQQFRNHNKDFTLPLVEVGDYLSLKQLIPSQYFTKPLTRFNESSLVRELEKRGIGRPSTYASIISTIQDRGYVQVKNHRFYAKKIGEIVTDRLKENFRDLMDYNFTASMENSLDEIANNKANWKNVLDSFFKNFSSQLNVAEKEPEKGGMRPNQMVLTSIDCPSCGRKMGIRTASTGSFLGCSGYILPFKERCRNTINLTIQNEEVNILEDENNALRSCRRCQKCNTIMDNYITDNKCKLHICGNNPNCNNYEIERGTFHINNYDLPIIECEKCKSNMHFKIGRFGKYMSCTNENCTNTRKILRNGDIAKPKEEPIPLPELMCKHSSAYFVLRSGALGIFLAANTFPKSHETRAPLIEELQRFIERLPEKLKYLTEAPSTDTEGNKTLVLFNRKMKQQYIVSKKDGKLTGWSMFYIDGKWQKVK